MTVNRTLIIMNVIIMCSFPEPEVMALEFCASPAVHVIATNPLSHASLSPSGSKLDNALCKEALERQETQFVVKVGWFWKGGEYKFCTCQIALCWRWWFMSFFLHLPS